METIDTRKNPIINVRELKTSPYIISIRNDIDAMSSAIDAVKLGTKDWYTTSEMVAPTANLKAVTIDNPVVSLTLTAKEVGTYSNLKLANGSAAPAITVYPEDLQIGAFLEYKALTNTWSKRVQTDVKPNSIITIPYALEVEGDLNGWVINIQPGLVANITVNTGAYWDSIVEVDVNGWVRSGTDYKSNSLKNPQPIFLNSPSVYNSEGDAAGWIRSLIKTTVFPSTTNSSPVNKISEYFTSAVTVAAGTLHHAFPGLCAGRKLLHAFYRKAQYHTGQDGSVFYKYSADYGLTWSAEIATTLIGGDEYPTDSDYLSDWRDCKAIRMSNGKFLLSQSKQYSKANGGTPPNHVDYDLNKCRTFAVIYNELGTGILDIANPTILEIPLPPGVPWLFGAGGLVEHNKVIYLTAYGSGIHSSYLLKSTDFGLTWSYVSEIASNYNESTIAFVGERMLCVLRSVGGNALIKYSDDYGLTWATARIMDRGYEGMYAHSLGDSVMTAGRGRDSNNVYVYFLNKYGDSLLDDIIFTTGNDSSYCDITTLENYVHLIYYAQTETGFAIRTMKIERSKVLGLSY